MHLALRAHAAAAWHSGLRSRSVLAAVFVCVAVLLMAYVGSAFSLRQPKILALDLGLSGVRVGLVLLNLYWVQELIGREFDRRTVILLASYPAPRSAFFLGRFVAIQALSLAVIVFLALALYIAVNVFERGHQGQSLPTWGFPYVAFFALVWLEAAVVCAFASLVAVATSTPFFSLAIGLAFAVAGRMLGPMLDYLLAGADGDAALQGTFLPILQMLRWALPDLAALDVRALTLYGQATNLVRLAGASAAAFAYLLGTLVLAILVFERRPLA